MSRFALPLLALLCCIPALGHAAAAPVGDGPSARAFFKRNAAARGVVALPGLQYKVLRSGPPGGVSPTRADDVTVRYEGSFVDGKRFDASPDDGRDTTTFPLQKLIPGWISALRLMRPGDVWMLYLPPHLAYGALGKDMIPPDATLIFKVELVSVATPAPATP